MRHVDSSTLAFSLSSHRLIHKFCLYLSLSPFIINKTLDRLPSSCTLILDFTLTHTRFGRSQVSSLGQLTYTRRTDGAPDPDGGLRTVVRGKIHHYRQLYMNHPEPIAFMPVTVVHCFCTVTVKPRIWLMRYQRNQNNLDFFVQLVLLILNPIIVMCIYELSLKSCVYEYIYPLT